MIYRFLAKRLGGFAAALLLALLAVALVVGCYFVVRHFFVGDLQTQVKLGKGQTGAAVQSGEEGVNVVSNRHSAELEGAANVQEKQNVVNQATNPGAATDAGIAGLHGVRRKPSNNRGR